MQDGVSGLIMADWWLSMLQPQAGDLEPKELEIQLNHLIPVECQDLTFDGCAPPVGGLIMTEGAAMGLNRPLSAA